MKTESAGGVCEAVLMPHAPILIPELGGERGKEASATIESMQRAARSVVASRPDAVLVISPHSPRRPGEFGLWSGRTLAGNLGLFGRADIDLEIPNAGSFGSALTDSFARAGLSTWSIKTSALDHGAFVPLYFLTRCQWAGPTLVMGLNYPGEDGWHEAGEGIRAAAEGLGIRLAIVASGDMSHRLLPGAPAGYHPQARDFDREFVRLAKLGQYAALERLDPALQELAAEDVVDSTLIAAHAVRLNSRDHEVFSYEGPFGVGYCVAQLYRENHSHHPGELLPAVAREAVEQRLRNGGKAPIETDEPFLNRPAGVFVTIRSRDGRLRGCRGTILPQRRNVVEETRSVALSSAFQDGRFDPVTRDELDNLRYEVSVMNPAEPVTTTAELDPHKYGVIITTTDGRRGLMLPEVEGLDTVEEQIEATCRKAGIDPGERLTLERFTTQKFAED